MISKRMLLILIIIFLVSSVYLLGFGFLELIAASVFSFLRMFGAYLIALVFSVSFGVLMGHNAKAFKYLLPVMDILQSVPILGFLPVALIFLLSIPIVGAELATIFLIFTCMAWSILFNVIEGVKTIPYTVREVAKLNRIDGMRYLTNIVFPAIYPPLISGSIAGWGGGWYFLVVGEFTTFGGTVHHVFGIGSFIAEQAYAGDIVLSLIGIFALSLMVLLINSFVWSVLMRHSEKFKQRSRADIEFEEGIPDIVEDASEMISEKLENVTGIFDPVLKFAHIEPESKPDKPSYLFTVLLMGGLIAALAYLFLQSGINIFELLSYSGSSIGRILIAYFIALLWTVLAGLIIERNRWLYSRLLPVFDTLQSIPAVAVFPIIVVLLIETASVFIGNSLALEIASILLLLTGMQWYLLFNIMRAIRHIPSRIGELGDLLNLSYLARLRHMVIPLMLPAIIAGSIEAIGGGWNATIVSESIIYKDITFSPETGGLGYLLSKGTALGDWTLILSSLLMMVLIIILTDKFLWAWAIKKMEKYTAEG